MAKCSHGAAGKNHLSFRRLRSEPQCLEHGAAVAVRVGFEHYWKETGLARGVKNPVVYTRILFMSGCVQHPDGFGIREDLHFVVFLAGRMAWCQELIVYNVRGRGVPVEYAQRIDQTQSGKTIWLACVCFRSLALAWLRSRFVCRASGIRLL
jgi:hypothetical protein